MLLKLSLRNIQRSFKDYMIYFMTLILGVAIFYLFNSIESQTVMMNVSSSTREIIELMVNVLSGVSVLVSFILGFLIVYASRFLMKRRNKEFGIYMTLGMSKRQISSVLLCETFLIGIISLAVGLVIGVALSQLMSIFVANMFEADMTQFAFVFSSSAMLKTMLYFGVIYVIVMIFNVFFIGKQELIDLLLAHRKNEKIKMKNTWLCSAVFLIGVTMLGYAYYLVTAGVTKLDTADKIFIPIALGIISTFMIFWSVSGFVLKIFMMNKKTYYMGLNTFTLRQFSSQMNTTVLSMGMICLMLFVTICVLSSGISLKNATTASLHELSPVDLYIEKTWDLKGNKANGKPYNQKDLDDSHISITESLEKLDFSVEENLKDVLTLNIYMTNDLTFGDVLGNYADDVHKQMPYLRLDSAEKIMRLSDYNKVAKRYNKPLLQLKDHEYMVVANFSGMIPLRNEALKMNTQIQLLGETYHPAIQECQDGFLVPSANQSNSGIVVVPDNAVNESMKEENVLIADYQANDEVKKQIVENKIRSLSNHTYAKDLTNLDAITKISIYEGSIGIGTMVIFIGIYIGVIFLLSSAAILALKELSESADNKERYMMLRKIGTDERMLNRALFTQISLFFIAPLILAVIHSFFGIEFCKFFLQSFGEENLMPSIIMTVIFIVVIYGGYMMITYFSSRAMLKE
ncbi:ABC transporter permease [Candidatus Stoquefichus massiliensis]|uniref:ABC transporter permease n=1 Tax=Candidatus Stoquefichus massiliensis TaxID=1470350 RepID=UPI00047F0ABC|nr:ABC transporter permease [Candidatus Stoquefichus massiliensis]